MDTMNDNPTLGSGVPPRPDHGRRLRAGLAVLGFLFAGAGAFAETMLAGFARVDITPTQGFPLIGYPSPGRIATGTRDPLFARVLVLKVGAARLGLVDLDLVGVFGPDLLAQL